MVICHTLRTTKITRLHLIIFISLFSILLLPYLSTGKYIMQHNLSTDFAIFYGSAKQIAHHHYDKIYQRSAMSPYHFIMNGKQLAHTSNGILAANLNPPIFNLLLSPLAHFNYATSFLVFSLISTLCAIYSLYLINRVLHQPSDPLWLFLSLAFFAFLPTFQNFVGGQVSLILSALLLTAWSQGRKQHDRIAGIALGAALAIKYFTGLFVITLLLGKRWRFLGSMLCTFIVLNLIAWLVLGSEAHWHYLHTLQAIYWFGNNWNASLLGWLMRLNYPTTQHTLAQSDLLLKIGLTAFALCGSALLTVCCSSHKQQDHTKWDLAVAMTIVLMLLLSPLSWTYYFTLLMLPLNLLIKFLMQRQYPLIPTLLTYSTIFLTCYPQSYLRVTEQGYNPALALFDYSFYCYALLLLCAMLSYYYCKITTTPLATSEPTLASEWPTLILISLALLPGTNAVIHMALTLR